MNNCLTQKIPKIIHQIWIGPKSKPQHLINSWKEKNHDWQHILWDEEKIKEEFPDGLYNQMQYDAINEYCGKADILRYEILYKYGGFYCDADTICLEKLDDFFLENNFFSCYENENVNKLIANGYIGSEKNSIILNQIIQEINTIKIQEINSKRAWITVGPLLFTKNIINKIKIWNENNLKITIYPSYVFIPNIPNDKREKKNVITNDNKTYKTYSDHLWLSTFETDLEHVELNTQKKDNINMKIGLSCIVKNESKVILKMLESVLPIIDYWHIVDTGSNDGTQDIIKNFFNEKNIPGHLTEIVWKDFSTSRNEALKGLIGKVDWGFWIDADEIVEYSDLFQKDRLAQKLKDSDGCFLTTNYNNLQYKRMNFFKIKSDWEWFGPVHEYLKNDNKNSVITFFEDCKVLVGKHFGNSWTSQNLKQKYEKYIDILKNYITENPHQDNSRWVFYLAQSYKDTGAPEYYDDVIKWYNERLKLEGYTEEKYISQLNISKFKLISNKYSKEEVLCSFLNCTMYNPDRIEHFEWIIEYYQKDVVNKNWELAYLYSSYAIKKSFKPHFMFVNTSLYNWKIFDLHCMSCFYTGRKKEMKEIGLILEEALKNNKVPDEFINRVTNNLKFYLN